MKPRQRLRMGLHGGIVLRGPVTRLAIAAAMALLGVGRIAADTGALSGVRHRVIVSTDIGGTDPDDLQSMVHFLVYADLFDIEGLISSAYGPGRKRHLLEVIDHYEWDYPNLRTYSDRYPTAAALRAITKEGNETGAGGKGFEEPTEGSDWIVTCARRADSRPLWVLVWGGIDDVAQALHDAADIEPRLRVFFIGGPNKKWSVHPYHYIEQHHPRLWIIEANATYRGWFVGGNQAADWGNRAFVAAHVNGRGALGTFFGPLLNGTMKMGDTPSVAYLLRRNPEDPSRPSWGGQYVRAWERPRIVFSRLTTAADQIEQFGILEIALKPPARMTAKNSAALMIDGQAIDGFLHSDGMLRFRFSPKDAKTWTFTVRSDMAELDGKTGGFTSVRPPPERANRPSTRLENWWTDDPAAAMAEGPHIGAKTVSRWREAFLRDFAERMRRCSQPAAGKPARESTDR